MDTLDDLRAQQGMVSVPQEQAPEEPEAQEPLQAEPEKVVQPVSQPTIPSVSPENQKHIKELREKARQYDSLEREYQETRRRLQEYEAKLPKQEVADDDFEISPDEIVEGKHIKKVMQSYKRDIKQLRDALENVQKQSESMTAEARLKAAYPDIERVINDENIAMLQEIEPETAAILKSSGDFYNKAVVAYKAIKRTGIFKEDEFAADKERAAKNSLKPRPLASVTQQQGESPLARAGLYQNGLTDEAKGLYWKEMQDAMKMR